MVHCRARVRTRQHLRGSPLDDRKVEDEVDHVHGHRGHYHLRQVRRALADEQRLRGGERLPDDADEVRGAEHAERGAVGRRESADLRAQLPGSLAEGRDQRMDQR